MNGWHKHFRHVLLRDVLAATNCWSVGSRWNLSSTCCHSRWSSRLPERCQDQLILVGKNTQVVLQAEEVCGKAAS